MKVSQNIDAGSTYEKLAQQVTFSQTNWSGHRVHNPDERLALIGIGRSACAFRIQGTDLVMKIFFPSFEQLAAQEARIYAKLAGIPQFARVHYVGKRFFVMDYVDGDTLFDCLNKGTEVDDGVISEVDEALQAARERGLNPSDVHLKNILLSPDGKVTLIDVARFEQTIRCAQWRDLKKTYYRWYKKRFFPRKWPKYALNAISASYKRFVPHQWNV